MMRSLPRVVLLLFAAGFAATAWAQTRPTEYRIEEAASPAGLMLDQLKPKIIAFSDRPSEELIDADIGLMRFEDWAQARPIEKQFLSPFPSYTEPFLEVTV